MVVEGLSDSLVSLLPVAWQRLLAGEGTKGVLSALASCRFFLAAAALVAACSGPFPEASIPASGVNGMNNGALDTIYYDQNGNPHFRS